MNATASRRIPGRRAAAPRPFGHAAAAVLGALALALLPACAASDSTATALPTPKLVDLRTGDASGWDQKGRPLVVNLWASWCTPCKTEMPAIEKVASRLGDQVEIVGVTDQNDLEAARKAANKAGVRYRLLVDTDQSLMSDLGIVGLPGTVFVDADGKVIGRHSGVLTEKKLLEEIQKRYGIEP